MYSKINLLSVQFSRSVVSDSLRHHELQHAMLLPMALFCPFFLFLWLGNIPLYVWYRIFLVHCSVDKHLGCFHVLAIVNSPAVNIRVPCILINYGFLWKPYMPWSEIAGSYSSSIFSFLKEPPYCSP